MGTTLRRLHESPCTEEAYHHWIRAFIRFHAGGHPRGRGAPEATAFLNHLSVQRRVSSSTQNQALCALVFRYGRVLELEMLALEGLERFLCPDHLPVVLSRRDVLALLDRLEPPFRLLGERAPVARSADRRRAAQPGKSGQRIVSTLVFGALPPH